MELARRHHLTLFVGNYGSGKSEIAVNYALHLAEQEETVRIIDLDVVNPYFRCREAVDVLEARGIEVVMPKDGLQWADLPVVLPRVRGALADPQGCLILDVGGDDVGARVLASLADLLRNREHALLQVLNSRRPFTDSVAGCLKIKQEIELSSKLRITGFVANAHMLQETTPEIVKEGLALAREVSAKTGLPVEFVAVEQSVLDELGGEELGLPVLPIRRELVPPWLERASRGEIGAPPRMSIQRGL
jgi:hypothetical protein